MSREDDPPGLKDLEERVRQARERIEPSAWNRPKGASADEKDRGALALAFRIGTELLAALVIGAGSGLLLDNWLGTRPFGMVVMFILGAAAGITNVYRAVGGLGYAPGYRTRKEDRTDSRDG